VRELLQGRSHKGLSGHQRSALTAPAVRPTKAAFVRKTRRCLQCPVPTKKRYRIPLPVSHRPREILDLDRAQPHWREAGRVPATTARVHPAFAERAHEVQACVLPLGGRPADDRAAVATSTCVTCPLTEWAGPSGWHRAPSVLSGAALASPCRCQETSHPACLGSLTEHGRPPGA